MARHFYAAPFLTKYTFGVNQKGTAVNTHVFFAVEFFQLDDVEQSTELFVFVGNQVKRQFELATEIVVGFQAIAGRAKNLGVMFGEGLHVVAEVLALGGTAGCIVFRVKIDHHIAAA